MSTYLEERTGDLDMTSDDLPRNLKARFDNIRDELHAIELHLSRRLDGVEAKIDALPHVLARLLKERDEI